MTTQTRKELLKLAKEAGVVLDQRYKGEVTFISHDALERFAALLSSQAEQEPAKQVGWYDEFGNVFPMGAWKPAAATYHDMHKIKWRPVFDAPQPAPGFNEAITAIEWRLADEENQAPRRADRSSDDFASGVRSGLRVALEIIRVRALARPSQAQALEYTPGEWFKARTIEEMRSFYLSRLPVIREAAKEHGYAIGLHGSTVRDFDLMAMQWQEGASDKDTLAHAIAIAACGITRDGDYQWEQKPRGRFAVSIPICWTDHSNPDFKDKLSLGHIDLSVIEQFAATSQAQAPSKPYSKFGSKALCTRIAENFQAVSKTADGTVDLIKEALPEFRQQDDYLLAHGASLMSENSHEIIHVDTLRRIIAALSRAQTEAEVLNPAMVERLQHAIEGECDGLAVNDQHAKAILEYTLAERDPSKPAKQQGMFRKFDVRRVDSSDAPGGKHYGCRYFVLDLDHDAYAPAAMRTYAAECKVTHSQLAADIESEFGAQTKAEVPEGFVLVPKEPTKKMLDALYRATVTRKVNWERDAYLATLAAAPQQKEGGE